MAVLSSIEVGFSVYNINLYTLNAAIIRSSSATRALLEYGDGSLGLFLGSGFRYDRDGVPVAGTITTYTESSWDFSAFVEIAGLAVTVSSFMACVQTLGRADDLALFRNALSGNDTMAGGRLNDRFDGFDGNDVLRGNAGNDTLFGGNGSDICSGGAGADAMSGGAGSDIFVFASLSDSTVRSTDLIRDFDAGADRINLASIDADTDGTAGNQAFSFIGARAFTGVDGQLRLSATGIEGDANGDRVADFVIRIAGDDPLAGDIIL